MGGPGSGRRALTGPLITVSHPASTSCRNGGQAWQVSHDPYATRFVCTWCGALLSYH